MDTVDNRFAVWWVLSVFSSPHALGDTMNRVIRTTAVAVLVGFPLLSGALAHADTATRKATISGVAWHDVDSDGVRQPDEPVLAGVDVGDAGRRVVTGPDGRYEFEAEPAEVVGLVVRINLPGSGLMLTKQHQGGDPTVDSDFEWINGWADVEAVTPGAEIEHVDIGYAPSKADAAVAITPLAPGSVHVGDEISYEVVITASDVPSTYQLLVTFPEGVEPSASQPGAGTAVEAIDATSVRLGFLRNHNPAYTRTVTVHAKVTKPADGLVVATLVETDGTDVRPENDSASTVLTVAGTPTPTSTPTPTPTPTTEPVVVPIAETTPLANTGVNPVVTIALGSGLLSAGAGALWLARRR